MSQGRQKWPSVGAKHDTLKNHGETITADIHQLLEYSQAGTQGTARAPRDMPARTYKPLFESILAFVQRATRPDKNEIERQREVHSMIKDIHTNVAIIKANNQSMTGTQPKNASITRNWAQIASSIAAPPSIQKTISGVSSAATSIDSPKHKEIVIRYKGNKGVPETLRKLRPAELVKALNDGLTRTELPQVQTVRITAARINARGSIVAHTETAAQAEILRYNREAWQQEVDPNAEVMVPMYPVVMHGVPLKSVDMGDKAAFFTQLRFENRQTLGDHRVTDCRWYRKYKEEQRDGSLIVDCETPEGANALIKAGTMAWGHGLRVVRRHDPSCQFTRCLKCYQYGKCKGTFCTNNETCGKCASIEHNTGDCTSTVKKCCLCGGQHFAWSAQCTKHKQELQRVEIAKARLEANPFYPEPGYRVSPGSSEPSSRQSTLESTGETMDIDLSPVTEARGISNGTKALSASQHAPTQEAETDKHGEFQTVKPRKKKSQRDPLQEVSGNTLTRRRDNRSRSPNKGEPARPRTRSKSTRRRESFAVHIDDDSDSDEGPNLSKVPTGSGSRSSQRAPAPSRKAKDNANQSQ
jgi:hypothetical protein